MYVITIAGLEGLQALDDAMYAWQMEKEAQENAALREAQPMCDCGRFKQMPAYDICGKCFQEKYPPDPEYPF